MHKDMFEVSQINGKVYRIRIVIRPNDVYLTSIRSVESENDKKIIAYRQINNLLKRCNYNKTYRDDYFKTLQEECKKQGWEFVIPPKEKKWYEW
jgi:hypothetical protein